MFGRYRRRLFLEMRKDIRQANSLDVININGKLRRKSRESKLSKGEKNAKEAAILRKGISVKGNCLENSTYPGNRLKRSPGRGAERMEVFWGAKRILLNTKASSYAMAEEGYRAQ